MTQRSDAPDLRSIVERHRRHVEMTAALEPVVRDYALMVCDDILNDIPTTTISEKRTFDDGLVNVAKLHGLSVQLVYKDEDSRDAAFRALNDSPEAAAPNRDVVPLWDVMRATANEWEGYELEGMLRNAADELQKRSGER